MKIKVWIIDHYHGDELLSSRRFDNWKDAVEAFKNIKEDDLGTHFLARIQAAAYGEILCTTLGCKGAG